MPGIAFAEQLALALGFSRDHFRDPANPSTLPETRVELDDRYPNRARAVKAAESALGSLVRFSDGAGCLSSDIFDPLNNQNPRSPAQSRSRNSIAASDTWNRCASIERGMFRITYSSSIQNGMSRSAAKRLACRSIRMLELM